MAHKDNYQKAADLLLQGAIMLQLACPNCSDPIYLLKDKTMFCVTCNLPVIKENESKAGTHLKEVIIDENDPIRRKIEELSRQLDKTSDANEIISLAETIKKLQLLLG